MPADGSLRYATTPGSRSVFQHCPITHALGWRPVTRTDAQRSFASAPRTVAKVSYNPWVSQFPRTAWPRTFQHQAL